MRDSVVVVSAIFCCFLALVDARIPMGVNLSPLGGNWQETDYTSTSTYVFLDIFKHCSALQLRSTNDAGKNTAWQPNTATQWLSSGYPASLPYTSPTSFYLAMCDIGFGGSFLRNGTYAVTWKGSGKVGFDSASATTLSTSVNSATITLNIPAGKGLNVRILKSDIGNPVTDVRIVPIEYSARTDLVFHPEFLQVFDGYDNVRFTNWQKPNNVKTWASRTTTSSSSQHGNDGVAVEHMADLVAATSVTSAWFSFPLNSADYNSKALQLLASRLPVNRNLKIYIEAGAGEYHGDTDRKTESLNLFAAAALAFASRSDIQIVPSATVANVAYIPYIIMWYGPSITQLKAISVPGQYGRSTNPWDNYNAYGQWNIAYYNHTIAQITDEVRRSTLSADQIHNYMKNRLHSALSEFEYVGYNGGSYFSAWTYAYRYAKISIGSCAARNAYPCSWSNVQLTFKTAAEYNAAASMLSLNASKEQKVDDLLLAVQRSSDLYDIHLDFLRRWETLGGGLLIGPALIRPASRCLTGGTGCGFEGMFENPKQLSKCLSSSDTSSPCHKFRAFKDYNNGARSKLPYTSADNLKTTKQECNSPCKWGTCYKGECVCFDGYGGSDCSTMKSKPSKLNDCTKGIGVNLNGINEWSSEWPFVDLFLSSSVWISQDFQASAWSNTATKYVRQDGYPSKLSKNQKLGSMMIRNLRGHMRSGKFICLYDGDGVITFGMDVISIKRAVGRIEVEIKPSNGLNNGAFLMIERTNPSDPIRNIRFVMPDFEDTYELFPFHPLFLEKAKPYDTIRFMAWQNTNGVLLGSWADRTKIGVNARSFNPGSEVNGLSQQGFGVDIEKMILLCNTLGSNAWFNMPHLATDEYVRNFATIVLSTLRPDVKIYIELSNENWGTLFPGGKYAQTTGLSMGLSTSGTTARFCYYMLRSNQMFQIWKDVFGPESSSRLEFVIASQSVNPDVTRQLLACPSSTPRLHTAVAISPYFGSYVASRDKNLQKFLNTTLPSQILALEKEVGGHYAVANQNGLKLITYESGQGMAGSGSSTSLTLPANRDPYMKQLYEYYYNILSGQGVSQMMSFISTALPDNSQTWGILESTDQDPYSAPKYLGILNYMKKHSQCTESSIYALSSSPYTCTNDCSQSGVCVGPNKCECYYGTGGEYCQFNTYNDHLDLCGYKCTFDQGTCVPDYISGSDRYWKCKCKDGYYGPQCSLFDCQENCNNNGQCLDLDVCHCYPGFKGSLCEVDCGCNGHGYCAPSGSAETCVCDVGWNWSAQEKKCVPTCTDSNNFQDLYRVGTSIKASSECTGPSNRKCNTCKYGTCTNGVCECWAGYTGEACSTPASRPNQASVIGMNLGGIAYYQTEHFFVDVMKTSSEWTSIYRYGWTNVDQYMWSNGQAINLRPDGYPAFLLPGQNLIKLMLRNIGQHAPAGRYVCLYDGDGDIEFRMDSKIAAMSKGRIEFDFSPRYIPDCGSSYCGDNGIALVITRTNPLNPLRNIRLIMPGFEDTYESNPFHPQFLESIKHYSVIRFKDWQNIHESRDIFWENRTTLYHASQSGGVAIEHIVQLSNMMGINPWISIPHKASNQYVLELAKYVKANLRPDLTVYLEYSNEVWNTLFPQGRWAQEQGLKLKLATDAYTAQYRFYAQRSVEIFKIWESVSTGSATAGLKKIMGTFTSSTYASETILSWMKKVNGTADSLGVAAYWDCGGLGSSSKAAQTSLYTVNQVLDACINDLPNIVSSLKKQQVIATKYNMQLQTYEAGQALVEYNVMAYGNGETPGLTALFLSVNRDPGMTNVYLQYINSYLANNFVSLLNPLMAFTSVGKYTKYGSWGHMEYTGQLIEAAPKYMALRQFFYPSYVPIEVDTSCVLCRNGCDGASYSQDYHYFSYMVKNPRKGDKWVAGMSHTLKWEVPVDGTKIGDNVNIYLWKNAYCGVFGTTSVQNGGELVHTVASNVPYVNGKYTFVLPKNISYDGTDSYFIEIRGANYHSYFSDFFTLMSNYPVLDMDVTWICGQIAVAQINSCKVQEASEIHSRLNHGSVWQNAINIKDQLCMNEYPASWRLASCYTTDTQCKTIRSGKTGKPMTDCVANISPYPSLALTNTSSLTVKSREDYATWLTTIGWTEKLYQSEQLCAIYNNQASHFLANNCNSSA